jgi:DNA polymerase I
LEDDGVLKIGHNLKFDLSILEREGITVRGPLFDTMIAAALLNPERRGNGMDDLARDLLGHATIPISDLIGKGKQQRSMLDVPLDLLTPYAAEDADVTWRLYERLRADLEATDAALLALFDEVEMPLVRVLAAMERAGVTIDVARLAEYRTHLVERIERLRAQALAAAGCDFNLDSPKQLGEVLFQRLGFRVVKKTKTGASTDAEVLDTLAAETRHPLPELALEYRELTKLLGTYVDPLPSFVSPTTGRLHASFHQTGAATGRLSSSDPNIQNIPIRTDAGREIRRAFVARDDDHLLLSADYSQVELRVLAHFSEDEALLEAFRAGRDIHAFVASQIFGVPIDEVDAGQRGLAKTVNFGIVYGQTAYGLARTLRIPAEEAQSFIVAYKATYVGLDRFLQRCVAEARDQGFVRTILGRRRPIPQVQSRNFNERALGERLAINTVIQGSAADLIKLAMVRLDARLAREGTGARMLIQVHDELVLETPKAHAEQALRATVEEMQGALPLRVPLRVDAALGPNWLEGKG